MPETDGYSEGLLLYRQGKHEQAVEALLPLTGERGLTGRLANYYVAMSRRSLGLQAIRDRRFGEAESLLRQAMNAVGRSADLAGYLACVYAQTGNRQRCADESERIAELDGENPLAWRRCALAQWHAGRRHEAYRTIRQALRRFESVAQLHLQFGLFRAAEQAYGEAREHLARAVEADGASFEAHYCLALAAAAEGDVLAAVKWFQRAYELRPSDIMAAYQLSLAAKAAQENGTPVVLHLAESDLREAASEIRQLAGYVCREPDFVEAFLELPACEIDEDLFGMLAGVLQMAVDEHPTYADLHHYCSRVFERLGRTELATEYGRRALEINPRYVKALIHLGKMHARANRPEEAVAHLNRAIACGADFADIHCLTAEMLRRAPGFGSPEAHLRRALELNPHYQKAADALQAAAA